MAKESTQSRFNDNIVGELGLIETGLPPPARCSQHGSVASLSECRSGRATLKRCEVIHHISSFSRNIKTQQQHAKQILLHPLRVDIPTGSITAIIGAAGSGKSTLLKFLACHTDRNVSVDGRVNLSGTKSYFPRKTTLHRFYTPRTYIQHYERLVNGSSASSKQLCCDREKYQNEQKEKMERLLDALRIDTDRRDTIVGDIFHRGLNEGEQRRLELGLMALGAPDTLFCESPIEGLDSETSLHVMEFLKGYISNDLNRRVIVTLDRPSLFVWNLIDNVILLSKGRVVYEGPRFDMESFFAYHKKPTPKRFSPLEHYLAVVNNFRQDTNAMNWETAFKQWQEKADEDGGDPLAGDIETCFPSAIPEVLLSSTTNDTTKKRTLFCCFGGTFLELLNRSLLETIKNPGMLWLRIGMYGPFTLFLGALFFNLGRGQDYESAKPITALLFYSSSFYIFMVVVVLPFLAHDRLISKKEVMNGFYHPTTQYFAMVVGSIPRVVIVALIISVILCGMVKLQNPVYFFAILFLALWNAEATALLMSICVSNYVLGIILLATAFGFAMNLSGYMLVPSMFPNWLRLVYWVPFHTYVFRSLMFNEFSGSDIGREMLESYEIADTNVTQNLIALLCYSLGLHCLSLGVLLRGQRLMTRK